MCRVGKACGGRVSGQGIGMIVFTHGSVQASVKVSNI